MTIDGPRPTPPLKRTRALQQAIRDFSVFQQRLKGVPLPSNSPLARSEPSDGYCLVLQRCRVRIPPGVSSIPAVRSGSLSIRYTISLYDATTATYFGRTYRSSRLLPISEVSGDVVEVGGDIVYFLSTIRDASAVAVIEPTLVVSDVQSSAILHEFSLAWCPLAVFAPGRNSTDVSEQRAATEPPLEAPLYSGSPRAMTVAPPGTVYPQQNGCALTYQLFRHGALRRMRHLVFDSELFGPLDPIPGLALARMEWGVAHVAGGVTPGSMVLGGTGGSSKAAARAGVHASANAPFQRWWSPCLAPSASGAGYTLPQAPVLAPRLRLTLAGVRLYLPPTFDARLSTLLCGTREVEMGLRAGTLRPEHVRIVTRALTIAVTNGHTVLHRSTVALDEKFVSRDATAELNETLSLLAGSSPRAGSASTLTPAQAKPGNMSLPGSTMLGTEADVVLYNYTPHEGMAISVSLEYVVAEPTAMGLGIQTRLKLPAPDPTELTSTSAEEEREGKEAAGASGASSQGSGQGQATFPGGGLFSGGTTLETRRHILIACQLYIPCDSPDSTELLDEASGSGPPGDGPALRRVFFANRASPADPDRSDTFTRRTLEIPLSSPNPGLRLTSGVWMDGGGLEALLQDSGLRHLYGCGNPILGADVRASVETAREPAISVMTGPGGGVASAASKAARMPPSAIKPSLAQQQATSGGKGDGGGTGAAAQDHKDKDSGKKLTFSGPVEEKATPATRSAGEGVVKGKEKGKASNRPPGSSPTHVPSSSNDSEAESGDDERRRRDERRAGRRPPARSGYDSPESVDNEDEDRFDGSGVRDRSSGPRGTLRVPPSAGEDLLAQLMSLQVVPAAAPGLYYPDSTSMMVMPGPLMQYTGGVGGATYRSAHVHVPAAGEASLPFSGTAHAGWSVSYGHPLPLTDRSRLVQLGIGTAAGLTLYGSGAGDSEGPPTAAYNPASAMAVEMSDPLSASTLTLTFAAYVPNALALPGTGVQPGLSTSLAGLGLDTSLAPTDAAFAMGGMTGTLGGLGGHVNGSPLLPAAPRSLYFAFQLYAGKYVRTRPASLIKVPASHPDLPPVFILQEGAGGRAGVSVRMEADPVAFAPSERAAFAAYMATCTLCIEVWDGDSLLPVGTAEIGLAHLLRQQAHSVVCAREYDVLSTSSTGGAGSEGGYATALVGAPYVLPESGHIATAGLVVGRLQVVLSSVGHVGSNRYTDPESLVVRPRGVEVGAPSHLRVPASAASSGMLQVTGAVVGGRGRDRSSRVKLTARTLPAADPGLSALLRLQGRGPLGGHLHNTGAGSAAVQAALTDEEGKGLSGGEGMLLAQVFSTEETSSRGRGSINIADGPSVDYRAFLRFVLDGDVDALPPQGRALVLLRPEENSPPSAAPALLSPTNASPPALAYACFVVTARETRVRRLLASPALESREAHGSASLTISDIADEVEGVFTRAERYVARKGERLSRLRARTHSGAQGPDGADGVQEEMDPFLPGATEDQGGATRGEASAWVGGLLGNGLVTRPRLLLCLRSELGCDVLTRHQEQELLRGAYGNGGVGGATGASVLSWDTLLQYVLREGPAVLPTPDDALALAAAAAQAASAGTVGGRGADGPLGVVLRPAAGLLRRKLRSALLSSPHVDILTAFREADASYSGGTTGQLSWPSFCRVLRDCVGVRVYTGAMARGARLPEAGPSQGASDWDAVLDDDDPPQSGQDRGTELDIVRAYREGTKEAHVRALLRESVTTTLHLYPGPGRALFLELTMRNPYRHEERFTVRLGEHNVQNATGGGMRLVTDAVEWAFWRACGPPACPDPGLSSLVPCADVRDRPWVDTPGGPTVTLLPGEHITLPLVYLSYQQVEVEEEEGTGGAFAVSEGHASEADGAVMPVMQVDRAPRLGSGSTPGSDTVRPHALLVSFDSVSHGQSAAVVRMEVHPRPGPVHRVLRFLAPENGFLRASLPLPPSSQANGYGRGDAVGIGLGSSSTGTGIGRYVRVPDADSGAVVISIVETGLARELRVRARVGAFPSMTVFRVFLYADPHCACLVAVWRVLVHATLAFDVHAAVGQCTGVDLVVKGGPLPRQVALYASDPREVLFASGSAVVGPDPSFTLLPRTLNRLELAVRPLTPGPRTLLVHMVDIEASTPTLLAAWMVTAGATAPAVTRVYDVSLPSGAATSKKIPYANEWDSPRTYSILVSSPSLVRVREPRMTIPHQSKGYLRLAFTPVPGPAREDVYIYINDEAGRNEETLLLRLQYVPQLPALASP